eukprot:3940468-Rhodomonas_salina.2
MHITGIACTEQCTSLALACMHASGKAHHWHCKLCMHTEQPESCSWPCVFQALALTLSFGSVCVEELPPRLVCL